MFKQIIVAMAGAIAAQLTAATLDFSPSDRHERYEQPAAAVKLAIVPSSPQDFFAMPPRVSAIVPFLGAPQGPNMR